MNKLNHKGFTLVEVLAVIVIIGVLSGIAIPNVMTSINASKNSSEKILIDNIKTAAQSLYEEVEFLGEDGKLKDGNNDIAIDDNNSLEVSLQGLVDNGFLKASNVKDNGNDNEDNKLINPKTGEDIGNCKITITKIVDSNYSVSYKIDKIGNDTKCPSYGE